MPGQLADDHQELRCRMHRFSMLLADAPHGDRGTLLMERVAFSRLFQRHQADELEALRALPCERLNGTEKAVVQRYQNCLAALRREYSAHIAGWTPERIEADLVGYAHAVRTLQHQLHGQMAFEEEWLLPLFARHADQPPH